MPPECLINKIRVNLGIWVVVPVYKRCLLNMCRTHDVVKTRNTRFQSGLCVALSVISWDFLIARELTGQRAHNYMASTYNRLTKSIKSIRAYFNALGNKT
ncbi:protein of unknown function [Denitratisoma oestradiolicum]|uniref:Uncharacterized protein n=1 Tax=Denitratisoma oestradiolicum TaxID=311182 RepID=A0A6S6Y642_9PROT|nr:protein of unknown function [Denitratisoma oestradiolicum]